MAQDQSRRKLPSTYAISGSNITLDTAGGLGALTAGTAVGYTPAAYSVTTAGDAFSYSESFIEGDDTPSATTVTSGCSWRIADAWVQLQPPQAA